MKKSASLEIMFRSKPYKSNLLFPGAMLISCCVYEVASSYLMMVLSNFYKTLSEADQDSYYITMRAATVIVGVIAISKSLQFYFCDCCALQWRTSLVRYIHERLYPTDPITDKLITLSEYSGLDNVDQRASQDVDLLTNQAAVLLNRLALLPFVIIYYAYFLIDLLGWLVPLLILVYFIISGTATSALARRLVRLVYRQERKEGDFRFSHVWAGMHRQEVSLLSGEKFERGILDAKYDSLRRNKQELIWKSLHLRMCTNLFEYGGAIVNYILVGYGIFGWNSTSSGTQDTAANRVVALSRGSYACLYLVNAFSSLVDCASIFAEVHAVRLRVDELLCSLVSQTKEGKESADRDSLGKDFSEEDTHLSGLLMTRVEAIYRGPEWSDASQPMLYVTNLDLKTPGTEPRLLVKSLNLALHRGMRLLVTGPSGCGKSTLLRVIAYRLRGNGSSVDAAVVHHSQLRDDDVVVCPQNPYCFPGTLRQNLLYPLCIAETGNECWEEDEEVEDDDQGPEMQIKNTLLSRSREYLHVPNDLSSAGSWIKESLLPTHQHANLKQLQPVGGHDCDTNRLQQTLCEVGLTALVPRLTSESPPHAADGNRRNWFRCLSGGERQRLCVARLLLRRPKLCLLDEITSALDEPSEEQLYGLIAATCDTWISVGHRSTLRRFHTHELRILPESQSCALFVL